MITQESLKEVLNYNPQTGLFSWSKPRRGVKRGATPGWLNESGYVIIGLDGRSGRSYRAHRLAWLWMTGDWPINQIDHINGVRNDNRWGNLRSASREINCQNLREAKSHNLSTGFLGVSPTKNKHRFQAKIGVDGRMIYVGTFDTPELAHVAYVEAKRVLHPGCTI